MSQWRALHAHTTAIEPLLLRCVGPVLERHADDLDHIFWERHYAGGPHLRIRLRGEPERRDAALAELKAAIEEHFRLHPSPDLENYSPRQVAELLEKEGLDPAEEDLEYRNDVVLERPYPLPGKRYASEGARTLAESFRRSSCPLALAIMEDPRPRRDLLLRLYLVLALRIGGGKFPPGCVSFKSHWEGFSVTFPSAQVIERIRQSYDENRESIREILDEVAAGYDDGFSSDPILAPWWQTIARSAEEAREMFAAGEPLTEAPESPEAAAEVREKLFENEVRRQSDFVDRLWKDERFLALFHRDVSFHVARALVNLLYDLVAALGFSPIDKMAACHHTFRAVEEAEGCDLNDLLNANIQKIIDRHGHLLDTPADG